MGRSLLFIPTDTEEDEWRIFKEKLGVLLLWCLNLPSPFQKMVKESVALLGEGCSVKEGVVEFVFDTRRVILVL